MGDGTNLERALGLALETGTGWTPPAEYVVPHVSRTVAKIVLGYTSLRQHREQRVCEALEVVSLVVRRRDDEQR